MMIIFNIHWYYWIMSTWINTMIISVWKYSGLTWKNNANIIGEDIRWLSQPQNHRRTPKVRIGSARQQFMTGISRHVHGLTGGIGMFFTEIEGKNTCRFCARIPDDSTDSWRRTHVIVYIKVWSNARMRPATSACPEWRPGLRKGAPSPRRGILVDRGFRGRVSCFQ